MQDDLTKKDLSEIYEKKTIEEKIRELAKTEMGKLAKKVNDRVIEMELDNDDHYLIYGVLGVDKAEGKMIDVYQNKGRFLYKYAGAFVEEAARLCFVEKFGEEKAKTVNIDNPCILMFVKVVVPWRHFLLSPETTWDNRSVQLRASLKVLEIESRYLD